MAQDISFDIIARDRASSTFSKIDKSSGRTAGRLKAFGKTAALALGGVAVVSVGLAAKLAKSAAQDQQSSALLAKQYKNSAKATDAQVAATERWISVQGRAKGVTDEDLRPALSSLVVATHKVGAAQKLASLAMNVSAGKGLALGAVSKALAKGAQGNTTALARLGVATKNADGTTKSFTRITKELGKQFAGQAATKANTFAGKVSRLKLILSETGEAIGYKLIPILTDMATWILNKGIPALSRFGKWFQTNVVPPMKVAAEFISTKVVPAFDKIRVMFDRVGSGSGRTSAALGQFKTNFASVWDSVKSIFTSVSGFAQAFWGRYGDLITKYGIGTLKNLLTTVRGVMNIITGIFKTVAAVLHGDWGGAWAGIKQITRGAVQVLKGSIGQLWNTVKTLFSAGGRALVDLMQLAWHGIVNGAKAGAGKLASFMASLPGRIVKAIGNLDMLLFNAGKAIIGGLISGITSKVGDLVGKLKSVTDLIPKHKGPLDKDRRLLQPAGRAIMEGLLAGIESKRMTVKAALDKITNLVQKAGEKLAGLKDIRAGFTSTFQADSLFGADLSGGGGLDALMSFEQAQAAKARRLLIDVQKVASMGLSKSLISQLQSAGTSGADQLHALASGSAAQIAQFNALDKQTSASLSQAGLIAGNTVRGGNIDTDIARAARQEALLAKIVQQLEHMGDREIVVVDPDGVVMAVKKRNRRKGVSTAGM